MKNLARKLIILSLLLSGTQVICLPIVNLSIFQITLIVAGIVSLIAVVHMRYIKRGRYLSFTILWTLRSFLAFNTSIYLSWAKSYMLLGLMSSMLIFLIPCLFDMSDITMFEKSLIRSQYITILFSIYSFYMFYYKGGIPNHVSLVGGMYIDLDTDTLSRAQAASQVRLTLPYATPPVLSIVMGMCIIILLFDKKLFSKIIRYVLLICYSVILVLTGSRTGIIGLVIVIMIIGISNWLNGKKISKKIMLLIPMISIGIAIFIIKGSSIEYIHKLFHRFSSVSINTLMFDRHFLVPLDGILIWIKSVKNFIFGIGFGSSYYMKGAHTYLPPYFLNSFITLIVERGIMGVILVIFLVRLGFRLYKHRNRMTSGEKAVVYALITGFISCIFYEGLNCYFLIYLIAIAFIIDKEISRTTFNN